MPSLKGARPSIAAVSLEQVRRAGRKAAATDLLLHELAHEISDKHDVWFATLLNWQRLRCGLSVSKYEYDTREERGFNSVGTRHDPPAAAVISAGMATLLERSELVRADVIEVLNQLRREVTAEEFGGDSIALGNRLVDLIAQRP